MTPQSLDASNSAQSAWTGVLNIGTQAPVAASPAARPQVYQPPAVQPQVTGVREDWLDVEFRRAHMEASVEQDIAIQIAVNRQMRGWSQTQLAGYVGTKQSAISRIEDPSYGRHTIPMLVRVAHAFDCALRIKLIPYSQLAVDLDNRSEKHLYVEGFAAESK